MFPLVKTFMSFNFLSFFFSIIMTQTEGSIEEPLFPVSEMGAIIPADTKKPFDIRKVEYKWD